MFLPTEPGSNGAPALCDALPYTTARTKGLPKNRLLLGREIPARQPVLEHRVEKLNASAARVDDLAVD